MDTPNELNQLDGVTFITGAGGGIGRETALLVAAAGSTVGVTDMDIGAAKNTVAAIRAAGGKAKAWALDVTDSSAVKTVFDSIEKDLGPVDYLVNAAGFYRAEEIEAITDEVWMRMFAVNMHGSFYTCRAVLPGMTARRRGAIVNMSSLHAVNGQARAAHYAACKSAVTGFTKSIAREKGAFNIRANAIAPGPIDTPLWRGSMTGDVLEETKRKRALSIPLGRLGTAQNVASVITFLLSPAADYVTGQVISIGGGEVMA